MSFADKTVDIVERLREFADLDAAEGGELSVVAMTREAADEIDRLRTLLKQASDALGVFYGSGWHYSDDEINQIEKARDVAANYLTHNAANHPTRTRTAGEW